MNTKTNVIPWDYAFADDWILVTDRNKSAVQVTRNELIPNWIKVNQNNHVKVFYHGESYWIPKSLHYPM